MFFAFSCSFSLLVRQQTNQNLPTLIACQTGKRHFFQGIFCQAKTAFIFLKSLQGFEIFQRKI
ncbi:MAG: hypothetical protein AAF934_06645, partial [Bacteroidota bacterium]